MQSMATVAALRVAKDALRSEMIKKLALMSSEERARQSKVILDKLLSNERFKGCHRISIYLSTDQEVNTYGILENIFKSGKECFIPKYNQDTQHMDMVKLYSMNDLATLPRTKWNIQQPAHDDVRDEAIATGGLDLMILPGLAFSKKGHRLGRGKGYYDIYQDRCLHDPQGRPYTIALAFNEQILPSIPVDDLDIPVDKVLFPDD